MRRSLASLSLLSLVALAPVAAQKPTTAPLRGWVKDSRGAPVVNAEVLVLGTKLTARAGDDGAFRIDSVPAGPYWIGVRRLGFEPNLFTVRLAPADARQFDVVLDPLPYGLPAVEVKSKSDFARVRLHEFDWRRKTAWGSFYTRDDLDRYGGFSLSQMVVRNFPFLTSYDLDWPSDDGCDMGMPTRVAFTRFDQSYGGCGNGASYAFGRSRRCAPAVSINGGMPMRGWGLGQFSTDDVEAVEVYRGDRMQMPLEFMNANTGCGLVVVWLK
jgi:hypothetical protein